MSRLPNVGGDDNTWGNVLNDFLSVEHNADGSQKTLPISKGGTGATDAATARSNIGAINRLQDATDVSVSSLAQGDTLSYDTTSGKFKNAVGSVPVVAALSTSNTDAQNTAALNAAVTAAQASGRDIFLPPGRFNYAGPWTVNAWPGMRIYGSGMWNAVLTNTAAAADAMVLHFPAPSTAPPNEQTGFLLERFTLRGSATTGDGLVVGDTSQRDNSALGIIRHLGLYAHGGSGLLFGGTLDFVEVDGCGIAGSSRGADTQYGVNFSNGSTHFISVVNFKQCSFSYCAVAAVQACGQVGNINFVGCEFGNSGEGLRVTTSNGQGPGQTACYACRWEGNITYQVNVASANVVSVTLEDCGFNDSTAAMTTFVYVNGFGNGLKPQVNLTRVNASGGPTGCVLCKEVNSPDVRYEQVSGCTYVREDSATTKYTSFESYIGGQSLMNAAADRTFIQRQGTSFVGATPAHDGVMIDPLEPYFAKSGNLTYAQASNHFRAQYVSSDGIQNDYITYAPRYLRGGTWALALYHFTSTDRGIYTIQISTDNWTWTTLGTIDGYAASGAATRSVLNTLTIADGFYYVRVLMATKNASSSSYVLCVNEISLVRTGA